MTALFSQGLPAPAAAVAISNEVEVLLLPRTSLKVRSILKVFDT